jgi:hypothetical protein
LTGSVIQCDTFGMDVEGLGKLTVHVEAEISDILCEWDMGWLLRVMIGQFFDLVN